MALLYPWATKEYLLWEMSLGQIIMYYNLGMEMKYPSNKPGDKISRVKHMSVKELKELREELRQLGLSDKKTKSTEQHGADSPDLDREELRKKYGAIDG